MTSRRIVAATALAVVIAIVVARVNIRGASALPYVPRDDSEVIERLPTGARDAKTREIDDLRRQLQAHPDDVAVATRLARLDVEQSRARSDPRYLGYAQAALSRWWNEAEPPIAVTLLRATIRQSLHDFDAALRDLDRVVALAPSDVQAWLTRSVVLTVRGRYQEAEESCKPVVRMASDIIGATCLANVEGVTGRAAAARTRLSIALGRSPAIDPGVRAWALSTLGECTARLGDVVMAEQHYRAALAIDPTDSYVLGALADLLLDHERASEAARLLLGQTANDALLLRLVLAENAAHLKEVKDHAALLRDRFSASHARGDAVHQREEARFELGIEHAPSVALSLAKANWNVQREPWDVRVLLEAALAAGAPQEAKPAIDWVHDNHLEDPTIEHLVAELERGAK